MDNIQEAIKRVDEQIAYFGRMLPAEEYEMMHNAMLQSLTRYRAVLSLYSRLDVKAIAAHNHEGAYAAGRTIAYMDAQEMLLSTLFPETTTQESSIGDK